VNDFDIFVGTSSGAMVSAFLANGVSPEEMLQVIDGTHPTANLFERKHIFNIDSTDLLQWILRFPKRLRQTLGKFIHELDDMAVFDLFWSFNLLPRFLMERIGDCGTSLKFGSLQQFRIKCDFIINLPDSGRKAFRNRFETAISDAICLRGANVVPSIADQWKDYIDGI
jgi:predicted acylesterase/phospholipase RssA